MSKVYLNLPKYLYKDEDSKLELVPVTELLKFREFNRLIEGKYSKEQSFYNIKKLEDVFKNEGITSPLIIEYSVQDNAVLLIEGNHRLNVALELGVRYLPARVVRRNSSFPNIQKAKSMKVSGFEPNQYGYVPADLKPSQVGIQGTKPIINGDESVYMYGGSIEYYGNKISDKYYKWNLNLDDLQKYFYTNNYIKLGDLIKHDELFEKYPYIYRCKVYFEDLLDEDIAVDSYVNHASVYHLSTIHIKIHNSYYKKNGKEKYTLKSENPEYSKESCLLHEIQHICQQADGRSFGRSHEEILVEYVQKRSDLGHIDRIKLVAYFNYKLQESEQEAMKTVFFWLNDIGLSYKDDKYINWDFENFKNQNESQNMYSDGGEILLAPNGKPSNLTPEQYKLVRTPEFISWFGDWMNSPETASKMLDDNGEPLVCYHGTNREFTVFRSDVGSAHDLGFYGRGFYFTFNPESNWNKYAKGEASYYGSIVKDYFIKTVNPFDFSSLSEYKGVKISYMGTESIVFLNNIAIKYPELSEIMKVQQVKWNSETQENDVNYIPISVLPELIEKYSKLLKTFETEDNFGEKNKITGYVKSEIVEYDYTSSGGTKGSYKSIDTLGTYDKRLKEEEIEILLVVDAIEKYERIEAKYQPEGYMTRYPEITDLIKKDHDGIIQSKFGDEVVVFEPTQIKLADGKNVTFDGNNPDVRFELGGSLEKITETENFKKWFGNSVFVVDKYIWDDDKYLTVKIPKIFYHETLSDNLKKIEEDGFDISLASSRKGDNLMPDGIFLKDNDKEIGVGGKGDKVQIPVYVSAEKVKYFETRNDLYNYLKDNRDFYDKYWESEIYDKDMNSKYDEQFNYSKYFEGYERGTDEGKERFSKWSSETKNFLAEWQSENYRLAEESRKKVTDILKSEGLDAIVVRNDEGSFGRKVYTLVVFNPNNIKSAVNNLGTFDKNRSGIIYNDGGIFENKIIAYHGTTDKGYGSYQYRYYTSDYNYAKIYAEDYGRVEKVEIIYNKPFVIEARYMGYGEIILDNQIIGFYRDLKKDAVEKLKEKGYDIILVNYKDIANFEVIPFETTQVKIIDKKSNDIYNDGGSLDKITEIENFKKWQKENKPNERGITEFELKDGTEISIDWVNSKIYFQKKLRGLDYVKKIEDYSTSNFEDRNFAYNIFLDRVKELSIGNVSFEISNNKKELLQMENGGSVSFDKLISASSRFKPTETVVFDPPLEGKNGAKLISYTWSYEWTMTPNYEGELKSKRVSDWSQAEISAETGRDIVHQYTVLMPDGEYKTVSSDSVPILLGYIDRKELKSFPNLVTASKTLAKQQMQLAILEAQKKEYDDLMAKFEKAEKPEIKEVSETSKFSAAIESWKKGAYSNYAMGDIVYRQDNDYVYETKEYKKRPITKHTIEQLTYIWVSKRVEEAGGKYPRGLYDLKNRVARQKRKVENILSAKMENGGGIEDFDWESLYNPSPEEEEKIKQEIKKSEEQEKEDWYQKTKFSKKWAATYQDAVNKTVKEYLDAKATYDDWGARQYKQNKGMVFLGGDDVFGEAKSIGSINEGRRQRVLRGAKMQMDEAVETLKELRLTDEQISNLLDNKIKNGGSIDDKVISARKMQLRNKLANVLKTLDYKTVDVHSGKSKEDLFIQRIVDMIYNGYDFKSKLDIERIATKEFGFDDAKKVRELTEYAILFVGRDISKEGDVKDVYDKLVSLYANQPYSTNRTVKSQELGQFSTPAPMAYLMGVYVGINKNKDNKIYFEPTAGNGMLSIAGNPQDFVVNELDFNRYNNLLKDNYKLVLNQDATKPFNFDYKFDGLLANPPFATTKIDKIIDNFKISGLENQIMINSLDLLKDNARGAFIVGGHTEFDSAGRIKSAKDKAFLSYLYSRYNVEDVINVSGSLYGRQGTTYPIRIILFNGRKSIPSGYYPLKNDKLTMFEPFSHRVINNFDELYERFEKTLLINQ